MEQLRISLDEAVYELERVIDELEPILQEDLLSPLEAIHRVLIDMQEYHIYTFGCMDPRVDELFIARRTDLPDYQGWVESLNRFVDEYTITIGGDHNEIE